VLGSVSKVVLRPSSISLDLPQWRAYFAAWSLTHLCARRSVQGVMPTVELRAENSIGLSLPIAVQILIVRRHT
jgi:hypothetical protein